MESHGEEKTEKGLEIGEECHPSPSKHDANIFYNNRLIVEDIMPPTTSRVLQTNSSASLPFPPLLEQVCQGLRDSEPNCYQRKLYSSNFTNSVSKIISRKKIDFYSFLEGHNTQIQSSHMPQAEGSATNRGTEMVNPTSNMDILSKMAYQTNREPKSSVQKTRVLLMNNISESVIEKTDYEVNSQTSRKSIAKAHQMDGAENIISFSHTGAQRPDNIPSLSPTIQPNMIENQTSSSNVEANKINTIHPHVHDVICGRGKGSYLHIGNSQFHELVNKKKAIYLNSTKTDKFVMSKSIVNDIKSQSPPGRFIEFDAFSNTWIEVDDKKAWEKTCQALKERYPLKAKPSISSDKLFMSPTDVNSENEPIVRHFQASTNSVCSPYNHLKHVKEGVDNMSSYFAVENSSDNVQPDICASDFTVMPRATTVPKALEPNSDLYPLVVTSTASVSENSRLTTSTSSYGKRIISGASFPGNVQSTTSSSSSKNTNGVKIDSAFSPHTNHIKSYKKAITCVCPSIPKLLPIIPKLETNMLLREQSNPFSESIQRSNDFNQHYNSRRDLMKSILSNPEDYSIFIVKNKNS